MTFLSKPQFSSFPLIRLRDIVKDQGAFFSLHHINFDIFPGEIHALVGEHGSGKTTLGHIIAGQTQPSSGEIIWNGVEYPKITRSLAKKIGIEMVPQDTCLLEDLSIAENFFILSNKIRSLIYNKRRLHCAIQTFLNEHQVALDATTPVQSLTLPEKALIEILRAIYCHPKLLILDEVMVKLAPVHYSQLIQELIFERAKERCSTLVITHRIDELFEYVDKVTILRNGEIIMSDAIEEIDKINLIRIAYTHTRKSSTQPDTNVEFYRFLKYNQAILEELPVNLVITDPEFNVKLVNEYAQKYFAIDTFPQGPLALQQLLPSGEEHLGLLLKALRQPQEEVVFHIPVSIKGEQRLNNILTYPIFDGSHKIGHILIFDDITEEQKLQEQIMLAEKLASVGLLAAGVAHEINHPLGIINNIIDYFRMKLTDQELLKELESIEEEVFSISHIISNLVSFSRDDTPEKELFDVNDTIETLLHLIQPHSKQKNYHIHFESDEPEIEVFANKTEIKQVLLNLIKNAFESMSPEGNLTIITSYHVDEEEQGQQIKILIEDDGEGIATDNLHDIFLPFYSTKKHRGGGNLGLGLFMSYSLIKKQNGTIKAEKISPHGTRFIIMLPCP